MLRRLLGAALAAIVVGVLGVIATPRAEAASLPTFPMALPVGWGLTVQAGGTHTLSSGVRSSVDLGAAGGASIAVVAAADGVVVRIGGAGSFTRCHVTIEHEDGWQTKYFHLKAIPTGLVAGQRVTAGTQLGMTAMPGSETCGRGSFRHVHFMLMRSGVEVPINGLSIGGYTVRDYGGAYCGYWTRNSDGAVVADARRTCYAVPKVVNNLINPSTLAGTSEDASRSDARPELAPADTIDAVALYTTEGLHTVSGRSWRTECEPYSQTTRCRTDIWASTVQSAGGTLSVVEGWTFNNLTYVASPRALWAGNTLGNTGSWTADDGRKWRTECDTAVTGGNGCRSYTWSNVAVAVPKSGGGYTYRWEYKEVFNNMVRFS